VGSNPTGVAILHPRGGFMAEWSKALDSSSSLHLEAWVRIPLEPVLTSGTGPCGAMDSALDFGSSGCRFESCQGRLLRSASWGISSIGRVRALQARGTGIETRILHLFWHMQWQVGRVVKAVDSKSTGLRPRQFESGTCRFYTVCRFSIVVIAPAL
jgi:hypothetical protein